MSQPPVHSDPLRITSLGRISYDEGYALQCQLRKTLIDARSQNTPTTAPPATAPPMNLLLLEHDPPVITVSKRPEACKHIIASAERLEELGIEIKKTDRGGDITYHGPGQLVAYAILDLKRLHLGVSEYMRTLEEIVINTLDQFNIKGIRDPKATGVWVSPDPDADRANSTTQPAKICAMGVRVSRWVTIHGLALNVTTDLSHFQTIIPCGLAGRPVTSIERIMNYRDQSVPGMEQVCEILAREFTKMITERLNG